MKRALIVALGLGVCAPACDNQPVVAGPDPTLIDDRPLDPPPDHPDVLGLQVLSRGPRRLSVSQLEQTLEALVGYPRGAIELDATLAISLGEPDYVRIVEETLEPSPLFLKFQMDIAGIYCPGLLDLDAALPPADRILARFTDVDENLRYLILRFLALDGADAALYLTDLRQVYDLASAGALGPAGGWVAVCAAMVTSPELLLY